MANASPIRVAIWEESFATSTTGYNTVNADPIKAFLEDDDNHDFDTTFVSKAQIEAGILDKTVFDAFLVGGREYVRWSDSMAANTRDFVVNQGGGYVGMGWGVTYSTSTLSATGYADLRAFQPTTQTNSSYDNQSGSVIFVDPFHEIATGLPGTFTPAQTSCCSMITDGTRFDPRAGASVVATNGGDALIIADDSGAGRGVYFGVNIGSYNVYSDAVDANTELLLENALAWSAKGISVPLPPAAILFLSGLLMFAGSRRTVS